MQDDDGRIRKLGVWLRAFREHALDLLARASCAACAGPRAGKPPFCITCGEPAPALPCELDGVPLVVAGRYQAPLAPAIRRFKFEGHSELAPELARLLAPHLAVFELTSVRYVPVPLHRARLVERGFNQSALLAQRLARELGGRAEPRLLERVRVTQQQAQLGREARAENVRGAFRVRRGVSGERVVLVDDVVTTGATARACVGALRAAGSEVLLVAALARAEGKF
ncbi:MAG TPA: phosphoribosyltransferase family protein [Polyangiaceae bacterium]|nr:phosphoribosyltransferase family protein [Polyangiaceae bacterium]